MRLGGKETHMENNVKGRICLRGAEQKGQFKIHGAAALFLNRERESERLTDYGNLHTIKDYTFHRFIIFCIFENR